MAVDFSVDNLTDVQYQDYALVSGVPATVRAAVTTGIINQGDGYYSPPSGATALAPGQWRRWSSATLGLSAREDYDPADNLPSDPASQSALATLIGAVPLAVWNVLTSGLTAAGSVGAYLLNRLGIIGSGSITVVAPVSITGDVSIVRGDDYYNADGRALQWSSATWPNLTGATIAFSVEGDILSVAGSVVTAGTGTQTAQVELSKTNTAALVGESYGFSVVATLADGHVVTLVSQSLVTVST